MHVVLKEGTTAVILNSTLDDYPALKRRLWTLLSGALKR